MDPQLISYPKALKHMFSWTFNYQEVVGRAYEAYYPSISSV